MTNYNERIDEAFKTLNNKAREERASCTERNNWEGYNSAYERLESEAKQALTSLTKALVAEAKPDDFLPKGHHPDACLNHVRYISACCGCQRQRARNYALDEFEQNLLKSLE